MVVVEDKSDLATIGTHANTGTSVQSPSDVSDIVTDSSAYEPSSTSETPLVPLLPLEKEQPPPYSLPPASFETSLQPPNNYLNIHRKNGCIKGFWRIDTELFIPPSVLAPFPDNEIRPNLSLTSLNGSITADVELVGGRDRALLKACSKNGSVTLRLTNINGQKTDIHAESFNGSVHLYLPRSFQGPITGKTRAGSVTFSSELSKALTVFSDCDGEKTCFLGKFAGTEYGKDGVPWLGDQLLAETRCGSVKFHFIDEYADHCKSRDGKSFWSRLFG